MRLVDRATVEALELRAPSASTLDYETIVCKFRSGKIFSAFEDEERNEIERRIMRCIDHLIPSLHTFFKDVAYLKLLADFLKWLTALSSRDTLFTATSNNLVAGGHDTSLRTGNLYRTQPGSLKDQIYFGWWQLFAFAMHYHPKVPKTQVMGCLAKPEFKKDMDILRLYANYKSSEITALKPHSPRPETVFDKVPGAKPKTIFVTDDYNEPIDRRCGLPWVKAYNEFRELLYIDILHGVKKERAEGITPLFVQRSIYITFFGLPGGSYNNSLPSPHFQGVPTHHGQSFIEDEHTMERSDLTPQGVQSPIESAIQDDSMLVSFL